MSIFYFLDNVDGNSITVLAKSEGEAREAARVKTEIPLTLENEIKIKDLKEPLVFDNETNPF